MIANCRSGVVIAHLSRYRWMQEAAAAASAAGILSRYYVGIHYKPDTFPYGLIRFAPGRLRSQLAARLRGRMLDNVSPEHVDDCPWIELVVHHGLRIGPFNSWISQQHRIDVAHALFERHVLRTLGTTGCSILHCCDGGVLRILHAARMRGVRTILDVPITKRATTGDARGPRIAESEIADLILVPTVEVFDSLVELGVSSRKIVIVPFGVDTDRFRPPSGPPPQRKFRVLFVGQIMERKGLQYLVEAFRQLHLADAELVVVGTPMDQFGRDLLKEYARSIRWIEALPYTQIHTCYQQADVFAFPSLAEGSALVTYEAMASGLASIVTRESGAVARDGIDGFVVPSRNVEAIKTALLAFYRDRSLAMEMGRAARAYVVEHFTWRHYRERILALYQAAIQANGEPVDRWRSMVEEAVGKAGR
jgi:glycosyltransferase involved in cell wall biosynthesis